MAYIETLSVAQISVECIISEFERMWNEVVVA
jgi:hypothetical protein